MNCQLWKKHQDFAVNQIIKEDWEGEEACTVKRKNAKNKLIQQQFKMHF